MCESAKFAELIYCFFFPTCIPESNHCAPIAFQCTDGTCIPLSFKCDSKNDCPDKSDETNCTVHATGARKCFTDEFSCHKTEKCISRDFMCDGVFDCDHGDTSDEDAPECLTSKKCLPNQSECLGGECIDTEKFCDGKFDCRNDEYTEFCGKNA